MPHKQTVFYEFVIYFLNYLLTVVLIKRKQEKIVHLLWQIYRSCLKMLKQMINRQYSKLFLQAGVVCVTCAGTW